MQHRTASLAVRAISFARHAIASTCKTNGTSIKNLEVVPGIGACLTKEFAQISLGAGKHENPREERSERFRHRIMRKAAYLNEKLGSPACTGCGRCSSACTANIADPVNVINKIMEEAE